MKKRITLLLLSALLLTATSCGHPMNNAHNETTDSSELNQPTEQISEATEKHYEIRTAHFFCSENVSYTKHEQNDGTMHIRLYLHDWDKSYLISLEELFDSGKIVHQNYFDMAIAIHGDRAVFFVTHEYISKPIFVYLLDRDSDDYTVVEIGSSNYNLPYHSDMCPSFIDDNQGYLFIFDYEAGDRLSNKWDDDVQMARYDHCYYLKGLLKTENGGLSWEKVELENIPFAPIENDIAVAKMITANVGIIAGDDDYWCGISRRTFITVDGGKTWDPLTLPPNDYCPEILGEPFMGNCHVYDFSYVDGEYILYCEVWYLGKPTTIRFEYHSIDLMNWIFVDKGSE